MLTKQHEILFQAFGGFPHPDADLEQYPTPPDVAVRFLNLASRDIVGKRVVDLGCGTGILTVGTALLGAEVSIGVDMDVGALRIARRNLRLASDVFGDLNVAFVRARVPEFHFRADTVVMNPPFGMRRKGSDRVFLMAAMEGADVVWTLLGRDSDPFVVRLATDMGFRAERVTDLPFTLKRSMRFHRRERMKMVVSVYRMERYRFPSTK